MVLCDVRGLTSGDLLWGVAVIAEDSSAAAQRADKELRSAILSEISDDVVRLNETTAQFLKARSWKVWLDLGCFGVVCGAVCVVVLPLLLWRW